MEQELLKNIRGGYLRMSKGQKRIADYILSDYDKVAFMTASRLGNHVGVSESTVVRFATALGFQGYPQLQKALQEIVRERLTSVQRIELTGSIDRSQVLHKVLKADLSNLRQTLEQLDVTAFDNVVESLCKAKTIYILGLRSSAPVAHFLAYNLSFIFPNVRKVDTDTSGVFEQLMRVEKGDMVLAISYPRYSKRTVDGVHFARERGVHVACMTDGLRSPIAKLAQDCLFTSVNISSFVDSLVAPMAVATALVVAAGLRNKDATAKYFEQLEQVWNQYHVYVDREHL